MLKTKISYFSIEKMLVKQVIYKQEKSFWLLVRWLYCAKVQTLEAFNRQMNELFLWMYYIVSVYIREKKQSIQNGPVPTQLGHSWIISGIRGNPKLYKFISDMNVRTGYKMFYYLLTMKTFIEGTPLPLPIVLICTEMGFPKTM